MSTYFNETLKQAESEKQEALDAFFGKISELENERKRCVDAGLPALERLAKIAQRDTGQAGTVRRLLLGLYNGSRWPFDLTTLRGLDQDLFDDVMAVLRLDARATIKEVHQYFADGAKLFDRFAKLEGGR